MTTGEWEHFEEEELWPGSFYAAGCEHLAGRGMKPAPLLNVAAARLSPVYTWEFRGFSHFCTAKGETHRKCSWNPVSGRSWALCLTQQVMLTLLVVGFLWLHISLAVPIGFHCSHHQATQTVNQVLKKNHIYRSKNIDTCTLTSMLPETLRSTKVTRSHNNCQWFRC